MRVAGMRRDYRSDNFNDCAHGMARERHTAPTSAAASRGRKRADAKPDFRLVKLAIAIQQAIAWPFAVQRKTLAFSLQHVRLPSGVIPNPTRILRNCPAFHRETTAFQQLINTNSESLHRSARGAFSVPLPLYARRPPVATKPRRQDSHPCRAGFFFVSCGYIGDSLIRLPDKLCKGL
jgi:hypothetical protein